MKRPGLLLLLWAVAIFVASSIPTSAFPEVDVVNADKLVHLLIFFVLAFLIDRFLRLQTASPFLRKHHLFFTLPLTILYGLSDEFHQSFVPGRNPSALDLAADAAGGLLYVLLVLLRRRTAKV